MLKNLIFVLISLFIVSAIGAQTMNPDVAAKARKKNFPGGGDEDDLKVQESLPNPLLKVNKPEVQKEVFEAIKKQENSGSEAQ